MKVCCWGSFCLMILISTLVYAQSRRVANEKGQYVGVVRIKFIPQMISTLDEMLQTRADQAGKMKLQAKETFIKSGIAEVDAVNQQLQVQQMQRVFRHAGKYESRHRASGLHLWYQLEYNSTIPVEKAIAAYENIASIEISEPLYQWKLHLEADAGGLAALPNDPQFKRQWQYDNKGENRGTPGADISMPEAWEIATGNSSVIVAIEDAGIDARHTDLAGNMWKNSGEIADNGKDDDNNGFIDDYYGYNFAKNTGNISVGSHGTHVAGTVAAETNNGTGVAGVAGGFGRQDGVRLMSCNVFAGNKQGGFAEALAYAADNGAVVSQNSWGGGKSSRVLEEAIRYFISNAGQHPGSPMKGGVVVFASGNNGTSDPADGYPASFPPVISVASTDRNDRRSSFSNYGDWIDISAPGSSILSTVPNNKTGSMSGTSMACPHVSGAAALIISHFAGKITPKEVEERLLNSADPLNAVGMGSGRLNVAKALSGGGTTLTLGDVNQSGVVDIVDALLVAQHAVGLSPQSFNQTAGDVNECNGVVDIVDALMIAQYDAQLISRFPCAR